MSKFANLGGALLAALLAVEPGVLPIGAAERPSRLVITVEQIAEALRASGVRATTQEIEPLCTVTAAQVNPRLKVVKVEPFDGNSVKVRLQCERTSICLPFYVVLRWQTHDGLRDSMSSWQQAAGQRRVKPEEILVRSGNSATLVFESPNMRMTLPVTCLQNGARGQRVRVISKDRKKIYMARVTGPGLVSSVLSE